MNKKITHEQVERVFGKIVWLTNRLANWNGDDLEYLEKEYNYLTNSQVVWNFLKQQEKREKLLDLYKEYFEYSEMLKDGRKFGGRMLVEHERDKIIEEIKEEENE